ncbi:hypothetical protein Vretifemale_470 [Volvox reticuliferus]|uniref:Uncharacterized protein n=1 Tax=Volvox reticuliferus TaxID=1737510 RepID=A0A8J4BU81_9CHLO|nr:hypothetical protein Vretifemale_470 [Volvox reticuliferus]
MLPLLAQRPYILTPYGCFMTPPFATRPPPQWAYPRKDPVHDLVQSISEKLAASNSCGGAISVYLELSALVAELPSLDRVVFIEPVVLLGDAQVRPGERGWDP